ncbi:Ig-like domain-containing protein [Sediminibacterium soli]|uniref:Ig-like domain-containing protein n=1 Tax=Sediminibacterium soli TaxID=2698829 RepID=UPI0013798C49|nr:Ig-like domain-containing protein [Sediminibacterium soli]NCI47920.1 hypothetical protein [Sediminibacterium soli]
MLKWLPLTWIWAGSIAGQSPAAAQSVTYQTAGTVYTQSFNDLPSAGGPALSGKGPFDLSAAPFSLASCRGWQLWMTAGSNANAAFAAATGSSTGNGVYSLGVSGSTDRALGSLSSSTGVYTIGLLLTNATGQLLNRFQVSFTTEQWRRGGSGNKNTWTFSYKTGSFTHIAQNGTIARPELNMQSVITGTAAGSLNGNLAENRQQVSFTIDNILWKPGEQLLLRWDDADEPGSDDICALDDLSFRAELVSGPPSAAALPAQSVTTASATVYARVDGHFGGTRAKFITDTSRYFLRPDTATATPDSIPPGSGLTTVYADLSRLQTNSTYYYFLLASNQNGVVRSDTLPFTTRAGLPIVSTLAPVALTPAIAEVGGRLLSTGGMPVTGKGINWWFTNTADSNGNTLTIRDTAPVYKGRLYGLPRGIVVYTRAWATNAMGTAYGQTESFRIPPDSIPPVITRIDLPRNKTYIAGDSLHFCFHFSEPVFITQAGTACSFSMTLGFRTKTVMYVAGSGTDSLLFRYIIQPGESDGDGIRIGSPVVFANGEIRDSSGNKAVTSYSFPSLAGIRVDAVAPTVTAVKTPPAGNYLTGNMLDFIVGYSKKIWLLPPDSSLSLSLLIGDSLRRAEYLSGSGSTALLFRYAVQYEDVDKDGIKILSPLTGNLQLLDEYGNNASFQLNNIGALSKVLVNPPSIAVTQVLVPDNGWYKAGDPLLFCVNTNAPVWVTTAGGTPLLKFTAGTMPKQAYYSGGSGTAALYFTYIVEPGDLDTNGIALNTTLAFNNGQVTDERGNKLPATLNQVPSTAGILLDGSNPQVKNVVTPAKKTYRIGDTLLYQLIFSENILVRKSADTPYLGLQVGVFKKKVFYESFDGYATLRFRYIVADGDIDKNGVFIDTLLSRAPQSLTDPAGNDCYPVLRNIAAQSGIKIDAVAPAFVRDTDSAETCQGGAILLQSLLQVSDREDNETISCTITTTGNGSVTESSITLYSNGNIVTPRKLSYTPAPGFAGVDSVSVDITDGIYRSTKKIFITVLPPIRNNLIAGAQTICSNSAPDPLQGSIPAGGNGRYGFVWESSDNDSSGFNRATGVNDTLAFSPGRLSAGTWFRRKTMSGPCEAVSAPLLITVRKNGLWTGGYDSNWHNPNNWCNNLVPDSATDVLIPAQTRYMPTIAEPAFCRDIRVGGRAQLNIGHSLSVSGNLQATSSALSANGTLVFTGETKQWLSGGVFSSNRLGNLIVGNAAGLEISDTLEITNQLVLRNKGLLITNDHLWLGPQAVIGGSDEQSGILGNIHLRRKLPVKKDSWQFIGHPFTQGIPLSMICDSIDVFGDNGIANGFSPSAANLPSAFHYDHRNGTDSTGFDNGWIAFTDTKHTQGNEWSSFSGIRLLTTTKKQQPLANDSLLFLLHGPVNTGQQSVILPGTANGHYHVLSNPYPCPIDLSGLSAGSAISNCFWYWHPGIGVQGAYLAVPFGQPFILPVLGTFIVRSSDSSSNALLFTEQMKTTGLPDTSWTVGSFAEPFIELRLFSNRRLLDRLLLWGIDSARQGFDRMDGEKFPNPGANLYSLSRERKKLSVDARRFSGELVIPLGIQPGQPGKYRIQIAAMRLPPTNAWQLHDRYLKKWVSLQKDSSYDFETTIDTASFGERRFEIAAYYREPDTATATRLVMQLSPVPANGLLQIRFNTWDKGSTFIRLFTTDGQQLRKQYLGVTNRGDIQMGMAELTPGVYLLELRCGEQVATRSFLKQ